MRGKILGYNKRLGKFFGRNDKSFSHSKGKKQFKKKEASTSTQEITCYECGKQGHIKRNCPKLSKKGGFKGKKGFKNKKAYVAWEDNEISSLSDSDSDESANLEDNLPSLADDETQFQYQVPAYLHMTKMLYPNFFP